MSQQQPQGSWDEGHSEFEFLSEQFFQGMNSMAMMQMRGAMFGLNTNARSRAQEVTDSLSDGQRSLISGVNSGVDIKDVDARTVDHIDLQKDHEAEMNSFSR